MKGKLPKDVALRVSTTIKNNIKMAEKLTFPSGSISSISSSSDLEELYSPDGDMDISDIDEGISGEKAFTTRSLSNEMISELQELIDMKKQGTYYKGKVDTYKKLIDKFDACKNIPEVYEVINDMREEFNKLMNF